MDGPTELEGTNPQTALAAQPERLPTSLERLQPASPETFRDELTACLVLVAAVGMTEEAKREWLAVAWQTLSDLPPDILAAGCQKARETCDHPAKVVPAILAETGDWMTLRRTAVRSEGLSLPPPRQPAEQYCTPAEAKAILKEFGLKSRFASSRA